MIFQVFEQVEITLLQSYKDILASPSALKYLSDLPEQVLQRDDDLKDDNFELHVEMSDCVVELLKNLVAILRNTDTASRTFESASAAVSASSSRVLKVVETGFRVFKVAWMVEISCQKSDVSLVIAALSLCAYLTRELSSQQVL